MRDNFEPSIELICSPEIEGAYGDHPHDPGGATNWGITIAELSRWRGKSASKADVAELSKDEACAIYLANYWKPLRCDFLPTGLDFIVLDCAINQGVGRATPWLQSTVRANPDGKIGPKTLAAIEAHAGELNSIREFAAYRIKGYMDLPHLTPHFGYGWARRIALVTMVATEWRRTGHAT